MKPEIRAGQLHLFGYDLRNTLHINPVFGTDIECVYRAPRMTDGKEHRRNTFVHLEIRLGLFSIAKNLKFGRVFFEFPDEISDYPVTAPYPIILANRNVHAFMPNEWQYAEMSDSHASLLAP